MVGALPVNYMHGKVWHCWLRPAASTLPEVHGEAHSNQTLTTEAWRGQFSDCFFLPVGSSSAQPEAENTEEQGTKPEKGIYAPGRHDKADVE